LVATGGPGNRTLADLLRDAAAVARALPSGAGGEVLLFCEDRYRFAAGLLGAWMAGFPVALPPNAQVETIRMLSERPGTRAFFHDGAGGGGTDLRPLLAHPPEAPARPLSF